MSHVSLFEQLTSSVSLSMMTIVSVVTLAFILLATVACRVFFSSSTKSKANSSSKQLSNKDKKAKETNTKKQPTDTTSSNKKKNNNKAKKNTTATPVKFAASSTSASSQSEESDDEQTDLVASAKKTVTPNKASTGKKATATDANFKSTTSTNEVKTSSTKQQQQQTLGRNENAAGTQSVDAKKKPSKAIETSGLNKQQTTGKTNATTKSNAPTTNKKQTMAANSEVKQTPLDDDMSIDQEDEGQWVTQSSKQVNNRQRNKGKNETSDITKQESSSSSNRKNASEKRTAPSSSTTTTTNHNVSSLTNKNDVDTETNMTSHTVIPPPQPQEPIELCQLLPTSENRYTASDNWWKQALNKQPTFTVDDIGEWPERDQDEQYIVNVKRIVPIKNTNMNNKTALTEKDINVDENDHGNGYKNTQEDEKLIFDEQTNSSAGVTGGITTATATTSQSKKKSSNVRRLS